MSELLWLKALDLHAKHQYSGAWDCYQGLDQSYTQSPNYWFCLSLLASQTGNQAEASACLQALFTAFQTLKRFDLPLSVDMAEQLMDYLLGVCTECPQDDLSDVLQQIALCFPLSESKKMPLRHFLANRYLQTGQKQRAFEIWQNLLTADPDFFPAQLAVGHLALESGDALQALASYQKALDLNPDHADLHYQLGRLSVALLDMPQAQKYFSQAIALAPDKQLWQIQKELAYLPVSFDAAEGLNTLQRLSSKALALHQSVDLKACLSELARTGIEPMFDLNYLGLAESALRQSFADIFILPESPQWTHDFLPQIDLGVLLTPGHEGLFLFGNQGIMTALAQAGVQITLFCWPQSQVFLEPWAKLIGFTLAVLPSDVTEAIKKIQKRQCELLYYWESGTDTLNYFLPFFQLAPIQFTSWGSVASTGNPRMQAFLSSDFLDPPGNEAYYREDLLRLPVLPMRYSSEMIIPGSASRQDLGLPEDAILLGSPHNPLKYSHDYLLALQSILEQSPKALLVMIESRHTAWSQAVQDQLQIVFGAQYQQVILLKRLPAASFLALCQQMDLILDPFPFGSGKLTFECLGLAIPILTLPTDFLRGRIVAAAYAQMGYDRLVATDIQDYIQKALALIRDPLSLKAHSEVIELLKPRLMQHEVLIPALLAVLGQLKKSGRGL